jgi:putative membrane protein
MGLGMLGLLLHWLISAVSLLIVAYIIPGIKVDGFGTALIASVVIGLVNATIGFFLKLITLPLGIFWLVINALMLELASSLVSGFTVEGFWSAFFGAIVLSLVSTFLRSALP